MPVTMRDVAQKADVSIKTVSRVVNDQSEISEATRERVLAAINELGYRPSRIARAMVTQRTRTVGFIIPDITNPFFSEVARGIQDAAQTNGYNVFMCNTEEDPAEHLKILYSLADQGVDGLIIFSSAVSDDDLNHFADSFRPIVAINRLTDHPSISRIIVDNYRGARLAVDHLVAQGHTAIGMLSGPSGISLGRIRRMEGFCDGMRVHGLPVPDGWVVKVPPNMSYGREIVQQLLTEHPEITALFCYNDLLALGAIRACRDLGRRVPEDCAIIGFDDIQLAAMVIPALTTVHYDKYALGQTAMNRLLDMLNDSDETFPQIDMNTKLVVRESA